MTPLHFENVVEGHDAEGRCANVLRTMEGDTSEAAKSARWAIKNWLRTRRAVKEAANLTPELDVQRVLAEALEVVEDDAI